MNRPIDTETVTYATLTATVKVYVDEDPQPPENDNPDVFLVCDGLARFGARRPTSVVDTDAFDVVEVAIRGSERYKGYVYINPKAWNEHEYNAEDIARSVVEEWENWCNGSVYGYEITYMDGGTDSCWNFNGSARECMDVGKAEAMAALVYTYKHMLAEVEAGNDPLYMYPVNDVDTTGWDGDGQMHLF